MNQTTKTILTVLITAIVVGGGVYWYTTLQQTEVSTKAETTTGTDIESKSQKTEEVEPLNNPTAVTIATNKCKTASGKAGFIMHDENCYAPGENIPETDCIVSSIGGCEPLDQEITTETTKKQCKTASGKAGFIMHDENCYAPGENIPETGCIVSSIGGCKNYE